jgi:DNA-binding cell septation regulator SpoVG
MRINEINIEPVKCSNGVVGFVNFVLDNSFYFGSIAIITRPQGGYRLCWPTKKIGNCNFNIVHPINRSVANEIENKVLSEYRKLRGNEHACQNDRFS